MAHRPLLITRRAWPAALAGLAAATGAGRAAGVASEDPEASPIWHKIRAQLFDQRAITLAQEPLLSLAAPRRADDPAFVPLAVRSSLGASVRKLTLVIDQNPSPIAALLEFPEGGALPDIETRARVDEYSFVRAIAETRDGRLYMATRYVKASGGCSAAAGADEAAAEAAMGRMRFRADTAAVEGQPLTVQWMVSHPNHSGMAMNQLSRLFTPAHYVRFVKIWQGERLLLEGDVDFALSENPSLRFRFVPQGTAPLRAEVVDTRERRFNASVALKDLTG
jgi:sulfur-oxidizing protein SoxY